MRRKRTLAGTAALGLALALSLAACGSDGGSDASGSAGEEQGGFTPPDIPMKESLGDMEGEVNILAWPYYAEDGTADPAADWVTDYEKETGCQANVKYFKTSDEAVSLMKSGDWDVVSASGDATLRLIASGDVAPVNTDLVPNYADVQPFLKDRLWNSVDGQMYGIPHGWGANLLMWRTDKVDPAPTSWASVFEPDSPYAGKITAYDSPIYIADAALYLMNTQPDLGIKNPYALDADQLAKAVEVLKTQKAEVGEYWSDYLAHIQSFTNGDSVIGTTWQSNANALKAADVPVEAILPDQGSTGWIDTWMVAADSPHSNCAYAWLDHIVSPKTQAALTEYYGEAPANAKACGFTSDKSFCDTYHAADAAYVEKIWYWTTPISDCLDGRTDVQCTDYGDWTQAWTEVKG
jgi:putative spermidine/putrescine transport system substrate-binding protein